MGSRSRPPAENTSNFSDSINIAWENINVRKSNGEVVSSALHDCSVFDATERLYESVGSTVHMCVCS